jgi:hypothetical protein
MVTNLVIAESQHEAIEEQFFWPAVRRALDDGDDLADRAIAQEHDGKQLLQQVEHGNPGEPEYHQALEAFIAAGRAHIAYEQDVVWPLLRKAMDAKELEQLGEKLASAKKVAPTRPHPDTSSDPLVQKTVGLAGATMDHVRDAVTGRGAKNPPDARAT